MMLERIHQIKGLGLLHDANGAQFSLQKVSFIYSDNGRGKSTLASVFRSCALNNPDLITSRRTIDGLNSLEVRLQFSNGQFSHFQNGQWDQHRPEILVFDADFVEKNVYSGGQVSTDQRKNLLQFALGSSAVNAQHEYDQSDESARLATTRVRELTNQLGIAHQGFEFSQFQQISQVPDADNQIASINSQIVQAGNISQIHSRALPQELVLPDINLDSIFSILNTSLRNIDLAAEQRVRTHLNEHNKPGLEQWLSDGYEYGEEDTCPYCNQSLDAVDLIEAYRSYFNQDYNQLKSDVGRLDGMISGVCSDSIAERLKSNIDIACAAISGWQEHLQLELPIFRENDLRQRLIDLRSFLESLKQLKETNLLESVGSEADRNEALAKWQAIIDILNDANEGLRTAINQIATYKSSLAVVDIAELRRQIVNLELAKRRHEPAIVNLFAELATAQTAEATALAEKQTKKAQLNSIMQTTLTAYKDKINNLLRNFGAQFEISNIDFDYRGGLRSDYALYMRGAEIGLNGGAPDFRTTLSEGDKRTLAFAFFIASIESDISLANKIVVIDDPMCSFDLNRKHQTINVIKRIHDNCKQLIVMAHDANFLRNLRDDILRSQNSNLKNIKFLKIKAVTNNYSNFDDIDIDKECESTYFKCYRNLVEFLSGVSLNSLEVAKSIRPLLEGYLHRRFPGHVRKGLVFGQVIREINQAQAPSPLVHAQNITTELNEINTYAGQFHHDTNPAIDQVSIVESELRNFVERALIVIYKGST